MPNASKITRASRSIFINRGTNMSLGSKLLTGALAVSAFAFAASAQDTKVAPREGGQRGAQKEMRHDGPHEGEFGRHGGPGAFGLRGIELTDAQKEQVRQIHEANKPSQAQMDEMRSLHEAKRNGTITAEQEARLQSIMAEGKNKAQSVHEQVLAILTPEQKAQLEQRKQEMRQRMQERRQQMEQRRQQRDLNRPKDTTTKEPTKDN